ncbi:MAG TPA: TOBE domain-containing protein [Magnetovibrio sp.]
MTLADRIVVMSTGLVQQIGTPDEIYEQPRNMFVASFLGNPPINYLDGTLVEDGDAVKFVCGDFKLSIPHVHATKLAGMNGSEVVLGLRPEDVDDTRIAIEGETIHGHVNFVMPVGSDQFLSMRVEGKEVFFRVGKEIHHRNGENVALAVNVNRLHLFDKETQKSLLWD